MRPFLLLVFAVLARAQDTAVVEGTVANSLTGAPINRANVHLIGPTSPVAVTDAAGHFRFAGVRPGVYQVRADRAGFAPGAQRQGLSLTLAAGDVRSGILVRLDPPGVITGLVRNEEGEPVVGAKVSVMQRTYVGSRRQYAAVASGPTDDRGQFRIHSLLPGRYLLEVSILRAPVATERYPPVYYPNVLEMDRALPLQLGAGEELRNIDVSVRPVQTARIEGRLVNGESGDPVANARIILQPNNAPLVTAQRTASSTRTLPGGFVIDGVLPGSYTLRSELKTETGLLLASQPLEVRGDLENLAVTLLPAVRLAGRITLDEPAPVDLSKVVVALEAPPGGVAEGASGKVSLEGLFEIGGLAAAPFQLVLYQVPERIYLKSARVGGQESFDLTAFAGREVDAELVLGLDSATVAGTTLPGSIVALIPPPSSAHRGTHYRVARADSQGRYRLVGIAPGTYQMYSFPEIETGAWMDDDYLAALPDRGQTLTFAPREIKAINFPAP